MSLEALTIEFADLKRRVDLAETRLAQQAGQFEFITGQLRDVQLYMHARFDDMDKQFAAIRQHFTALTDEVRALPRVIAELIKK